jgi:ATP-dependent DNA helicase RecG
MLIANNRTEFKETLNDKLEKEIVGFLNYQEGGILYIGVNNDGMVVGINNIDDVQLRVADRIKNNILPSTLGLFDVVAEVIDSKNVLRIVISSGPEKPYYIKIKGMPPPLGCFIRIGSPTHPMTTTKIDDLYSKRTRNSLGKIVSPRKELSFEQLKIYYEENGYVLNKKFTQSLELLTEGQRYNYVAYLVSDENSTSMKVAKYSGLDKVDLIKNAEFGYCSIIKATKNILNKLDIENITKAKITSKERIERRLIDQVALREAVINAIVHNDYSNEIPPLIEIFSDRIVITSSGGLPQALTTDEFFSGFSAPRNKELMRIFNDVKLVEQLGSGILRILKNYDRFNI